MTKKEWERKLGIWQGLLANAKKNQMTALNENSKRVWGMSIHRCEKGIQECKASLAEFIGKK